MTLQNLLREKIARQGFISVAEYMELALRHPGYGYYTTRNPFGAKGDFITAPEVSQLFGEMLGIWVISVLRQMPEKEIALVELGPGRGIMMADILRVIGKKFGNFSVHLVEISQALKKLQQENLKAYLPKITWHESIKTLPEIPSIIIANEFFDALPVHQLIQENDSIKEIVIKNNEEKFYFSSAETLFSKNMKNLSEKPKHLYEISPESLDITKELTKKIMQNSGAILAIDYGYEKSNGGSSLQAIKNHKFSNFLDSPGEADLTAHVDFLALKNTAKKLAAKTTNIISQKDFLTNLGIEIRSQILQKNANEKQQEQINTAVKRLISTDQMGDLFKALAISSPDIEIAGF